MNEWKEWKQKAENAYKENRAKRLQDAIAKRQEFLNGLSDERTAPTQADIDFLHQFVALGIRWSISKKSLDPVW